ncbi:hypothetical protein GGP84_003246 [Salinibacter ruber]|uniref:sulfotransferase family protein n=1 Tax=Salinibacter ruber TaxID=146919 RepID=UPI0021677E2A|nr:sulfotransferase [Salinibacter ruber]MCS3940594.1 hypothetical protein [Salinibacter ruber]
MLPDFLGIGVPKAGSTWLHGLLESHPEIWVPQDRREVRFLNQVPKRTLQWYEQFFPSDGAPYTAVGEVTPYYLYCNDRQLEFLRREIPGARKFIVILRNPVERVYSSYWFKRRVANIDKSFREYVDRNEGVLEQSEYVPHIRKWLSHFGRENFLFLILEEDVSKPQRAKRKVSDFLGVSASDFPEEAGTQKKNERWVPVFGDLYAWATNFADRLRRRDLDWVVRLAEQAGAKRIFGRQTVEDRGMDDEIRAALNARLLDQVPELEKLIDRDLSVWQETQEN